MQPRQTYPIDLEGLKWSGREDLNLRPPAPEAGWRLPRFSPKLLLFVAITRFWGVCFRSQRLRLARLMGEFSDGFLTVVAATALLYGLRSTLLQYWFSAASTGKLHAPAEVSVLAV